MRRVLLLALLAGCHDAANSPTSGTVRRFAVDHITIATTATEARALADDLNGDHTGDNQLGAATASLAEFADVTSHGDDMIAAGAIASVVEIQADDFQNDPAVSVMFTGAPDGGGTAMIGAFVDGKLLSNRTRDKKPLGAATVHLPVFADADPTVIGLDSVEIDLTPDGNDGYDAVLRGVADPMLATQAAATGLFEMMMWDPHDHVDLAGFTDTNGDGVLTTDEVATAPLVKSLLPSDLTIAGKKVMSLAVGLHLTPCDAGQCTGAIADTCHDRVRDGDETDVDCGGTCATRCPGAAACSVAADCQSDTCTAGHCVVPSCSDGIQDGFETGVDCGWHRCRPC